MASQDYDRIFNDGERLIPGESHDLAETIRHKSSYQFFRAVIEAERLPGLPLRILDLGCGVGHGAHALAEIPDAQIVGVDPSVETIGYAAQNYAAPNIEYVHATAEDYVDRDEPFDYVVSRHALEHVDNGLELARRFRFSRRLMINVPYREPEGNIHHKLHYIDETSFAAYAGAEFFYEDLLGVTESDPDALAVVNSIVCVLGQVGSPTVRHLLSFPFPAWQPPLLERLAIENSQTAKLLKADLVRMEARMNEMEVRSRQFTEQLAQQSALQLAQQQLEARLAVVEAKLDAIRKNPLVRLYRRAARLVRG